MTTADSKDIYLVRTRVVMMAANWEVRLVVELADLLVLMMVY